MNSADHDILLILDKGCDSYVFPMLDNGYVYLAATRMSLHRSPEDWALVFEAFGYSPRTGIPNVGVCTFASRLHEREKRVKYTRQDVYEGYLVHHPHDELRFFTPIDSGEWQDPDNDQFVAEGPADFLLRGRAMRLPELTAYGAQGIDLKESSRVRVFELCRYLAAVARDEVLATPEEQRVNVRPEMSKILQLEDWHHPNVVDAADRPSGSETFKQIAKVLETGNVALYKPTQPPNTHWRNWPAGGSL